MTVVVEAGLRDDTLRGVLTGHREETHWVDVLDYKERRLGTLGGVTDGELTYSIHNTIRGGGSLTVEGANATLPWNRVKLQPWLRLTDRHTGQRHEWPLGIFLPAVPGTTHRAVGPTVRVSLLDKTKVLDEDETSTTWTVDTGMTYTDAVRDVLESVGETKVAIADTTKTVPAPMVWDPGTPKRKIAADLLKAANYFALWVDGAGWWRAEPYRAPGDRETVWEFLDDQGGVYVPEFSHEADYSKVPNRVVCIGRSDGETPALVGVAENTDPDSPWSYQSRGVDGTGRWVTRTESDVEAPDQATLDAIAARLLVEGAQVTSTFEVEHPWLPVDLNDVVRFRNEPAGINIPRAVIQSQTVPLFRVGATVKTKLREVV